MPQSAHKIDQQTDSAKPRLGMLMLSFASVLVLGYSLSERLLEPSRRREHQSQRFGAVVSASPRAERLVPGKLVWQPLARGESVYAKEKIRTGATDFVQLTGLGGGDIRIGNSASLELDRAGAQVSARLSVGRVSVDAVSSLLLSLPNGTLKLLSATAMIHAKTPAGTVIALRKGRATLNFTARSMTIAPGELVTIGTDGSVKAGKFAINLATPAESDVLVARDSTLLVGLHWVPDQPAILSWEVATDLEFSRVLQKGLSHDGRATVRLAPGNYYWRVWDEKAVTSYVGRFQIVTVSQVKIDAPEKLARVAYWKNLSNFSFEWQAPQSEAADQAKYRIELSKRRDFGEGLIKLEAQAAETSNRYRAVLDADAQHALLAAPSGEWYWRLVSEFPNPPTSLYSETRTITVSKLPGLEAARLYSPKDDGIESSPKEHVTLSWSAVAEAASYRVFVWKSGENRPAEATYSSPSNLVKVPKKALKLGQSYEWTVAPVGVNGTVGGFAKKRRFKLFSSSRPRTPVPRAPHHGELVRMPSESQPLKLVWGSGEPTSSYKVLVEKREGENDWRQVWSKALDPGSTEAGWVVESTGSYRWWISAFDELGRSSEQSRLTEFEIIEPAPSRLAAPKLPAPKLPEAGQ